MPDDTDLEILTQIADALQHLSKALAEFIDSKKKKAPIPKSARVKIQNI